MIYGKLRVPDIMKTAGGEVDAHCELFQSSLWSCKLMGRWIANRDGAH